MTVTKEKCVVSIEYEVKEVGTTEIVDTNVGAEPLEFITGIGQVIPGLENGLEGMSADEKADILVEAKDAYGTRDDNAKQVLPIEQFAGVELKEGMSLYGQGEGGQTVQVVVQEFDDTNVTIDFNHPLAGKDLMFSVSLISVRETTPEEDSSGVIGGKPEGSCGSGCGCSH